MGKEKFGLRRGGDDKSHWSDKDDDWCRERRRRGTGEREREKGISLCFIDTKKIFHWVK